MIGSPNAIEVLLHCHCCPKRHERADAPAVVEAIAKLENVGAIEKGCGENFYRTTPLGAAWVKALCNVPIPRRVFVDQQGNIL